MPRYFLLQKTKHKHLIVIANNGATLGTLEPHGEIFKRSPVFMDDRGETEFTSKCLRELADELDKKFKK
jgi:hypothetical protein